MNCLYADLGGDLKSVLFFPRGVGASQWSMTVPTPFGQVFLRDGTAVPLPVACEVIPVLNTEGISVVETPYLASALEQQPNDLANKVRCALYQRLAEKQKSLSVHTLLSPFAHQWISLAATCSMDIFWLLDEMGTGKSLPVILGTAERMISNSLDQAVVVCPNSAKWSWCREVAKCNGFQAVALDGTAKAMTQQASKPARYYTINYEAARVRVPVLTQLFQRGRTALILDESHHAKSWDSQTAEALRLLRQQAQQCYLLTGTPRSVSNEDIFSQFWFLDPVSMGRSLLEFRDRFSVMGGNPGEEKNQSLLRALVASISLCRKKDVLDLPPKLYERRDIQLEGEQARLYSQMKNEFRAWAVSQSGEEIDRQEMYVQVQLLRLIQLASNPHLLGFDKAPIAKVNELDQDVEESCRHTKLVIWTSFEGNVEMLCQRYARYQPALLYGKVTGKRRDADLLRFSSDSACRMVIGTPETGGESINLTEASVVINFDRRFRAIPYWQSQDRSHRPGQTKPVTVVNYVALGTVDEMVDRRLARREEEARVAVGHRWSKDALLQLLA